VWTGTGGREKGGRISGDRGLERENCCAFSVGNRFRKFEGVGGAWDLSG